MPSFKCFESWIVLGLILEVAVLIWAVPTLTRIMQWNEALKNDAQPTLLKIRAWRKELRYLRYAVEEMDVLAVPSFFKTHPLGKILRWVLPYLAKS
jgi:hypothetical protein